MMRTETAGRDFGGAIVHKVFCGDVFVTTIAEVYPDAFDPMDIDQRFRTLNDAVAAVAQTMPHEIRYAALDRECAIDKCEHLSNSAAHWARLARKTRKIKLRILYQQFAAESANEAILARLELLK